MQDKELEILLCDAESDRVERKPSLNDREKICQAICAFANDLPNHGKPGVVFIGANDDGSCTGLSVTDELLRNVAGIRSEGNILPFPLMAVQKKMLGGRELAVVLVEPSDSTPIRYRGQVWIRVGPRRAIATLEEERRLTEKRRSRDLPFDLNPIPSAASSDLDVERFRREYLPSALAPDILEHNQRAIEQQLASLRFTTAADPVRPTVLGMLVIGRDPRQYLPGAYIQFIRLEGSALTDPIKDQKELDGPVSDQLRMLDELFQAHTSVSSSIAGHAVEVRHADYPLAALQQLARNAVLHRTYEGTHAPVRIHWFSDRIEIVNPGGPFGQVSRSNFGTPGITDYRNPHLAEAMKNLGYVQRFGVGIEIARNELKKNGNPPPEFVVEDTHVLVILKQRLA
jgi:ATP-dependent DNA helicase RecG